MAILITSDTGKDIWRRKLLIGLLVRPRVMQGLVKLLYFTFKLSKSTGNVQLHNSYQVKEPVHLTFGVLQQLVRPETAERKASSNAGT